ncbi:VIR protein [Plasmodium vivax]|uniref:VIR protein n=1 Tax=Plasmodium vivax TaxID=5855 RepID=A0A1G4E0Y6_PLAVI|nr:VIR protein [Plasmodium vivax]
MFSLVHKFKRIVNVLQVKILNKFYVDCSAKVFDRFLPRFYNVKGEYLDHIKKITDPILKYVSIYLVEYYIDGYNYYHNSEESHRTEACGYLNKWLQEKKDLFTYGEKCKTKMNLWTNEIETLWKMLKINKYTIPDNNSRKPWCNEITLTHKTIYPSALTSMKCEESISQDYRSTYSPPSPVTEKCECSPSEVPVTPEQLDHPVETDRTKNLAVTSGFTAAGTLGTLFFLYRFTPMMSWFRRPGMNNVGTDLYMNPGGAESFISMQQGNGSNNLFYQP